MIASTRIPRIIINTSVNAGINTINPFTLLRMKGTNPSLTITGQGNKGAMAQLNLSASDTTTSLPNCSLIATDTGFFGATFQMEVSPHYQCQAGKVPLNLILKKKQEILVLLEQHFKLKKKAGTDAKGQFKSLHIDNAESVGNRKIG
jgi:hypothetical protein